MSKHERLTERQCLYCGKEFTPPLRGKWTARYCSRSCATLSHIKESRKKVAEKLRKPLIEKTCLQCGKVFMIRSSGRVSANRKFCSPGCTTRYRMRDPELGRWLAARMRQHGNGLLGRKRPDVAERMRKNNPMSNSETKEKMRQSLTGRTFLSRGGNGQVTTQQKKLCEALGLPDSAMEFVILTIEARGQFQSLPNSYKVDLGIPEVRLAIEVDGKTHTSKKWKFLDRRKTAVLNFLGWTVLRFWNNEVDQDLERCVQAVMSTISRLKETTITSPTES